MHITEIDPRLIKECELIGILCADTNLHKIDELTLEIHDVLVQYVYRDGYKLSASLWKPESIAIIDFWFGGIDAHIDEYIMFGEKDKYDILESLERLPHYTLFDKNVNEQFDLCKLNKNDRLLQYLNDRYEYVKVIDNDFLKEHVKVIRIDHEYEIMGEGYVDRQTKFREGTWKFNYCSDDGKLTIEGHGLYLKGKKNDIWSSYQRDEEYWKRLEWVTKEFDDGVLKTSNWMSNY